MEYDVFISHTIEDKEAVARPLARHLQELGLRVWIDECELTFGDSLRRKIDAGLAQSQYGVVVLSPAFFGKEWPNKELDGLVAREDGTGNVVLPIWHNVNSSDVLRYSPLLAAKVAVSTTRGMPHVASSVLSAVRRGLNQTNDTNSKLASLESDLLGRIRRDMLTADSSVELRRSNYELEGHLVRYPHSVEARELQDQLKMALRRAEQYERPTIWDKRACPMPSASPARSASSFARLLIGAVVALTILYAALRYFGVVSCSRSSATVRGLTLHCSGLPSAAAEFKR